MPEPDPTALADTVAAHDTGGLLGLGFDPGMPDVAALAAALVAAFMLWKEMHEHGIPLRIVLGPTTWLPRWEAELEPRVGR